MGTSFDTCAAEWPKLKGIRCPNPANQDIRTLWGLKKRFNIENSWCVGCLRCLCERLLELPEKERNDTPVSLLDLDDPANHTCTSCNYGGLCDYSFNYVAT